MVENPKLNRALEPSPETADLVEWPEITGWDDFCAAVARLSELVPLGLRRESNWQAYRRYMERLKSWGIPMEAPILRKIGDKPAAVLQNKFPYDRLVDRVNGCLDAEASGLQVEHICAWANNSSPAGLDEAEIGQLLQDALGERLVDWCGHVHHQADRSIGGLWHAHIFVLRRVGDGLPEAGEI